MKVIECKCGYQDDDLSVVQSLTSCGFLEAIVCKGCGTLTNKYIIKVIDGPPKQQELKCEGYTLEEIEALNPIMKLWREFQGEWKKIVITYQPQGRTHPYTAYEEREKNFWSIDLIYPSEFALYIHYNILGAVSQILE